MKNPKKSHVERIASVEIKKTVSVIKCFICNQMFYSQKTFDDHMKVHSSKLTRNVPEEIQRKTMESFRVKKNLNTSSSKQMGVHGKKILNQTTTAIRPKMEEEDEDEKQQDLNRQQIMEAEQALRESTILIEKLQAIMQEKPEKLKQFRNNEKIQQYSPTLPVKQLSQQQFLQLIISNGKISCKEAEKTKFTNQYLQSCQDQLLYLKNMLSYLEKDQINIGKYEKMTGTILEAMIKYVRQNAVVQTQQQYIKEDQGLYLTHITEKTNKSQKQIIDQQERGVDMVENEEVVYCNQCYMVIEYGEDCYRQKTNNKKTSAQTPRSYHTDCWQQRHQQNTHPN